MRRENWVVNVAIVSGGGKRRIKFHIDAGGLHDLRIQVKKGRDAADLLWKGMIGIWVGKFGSRVIQSQRPVPERQ
jgi:hypothetical protein